jgi:AcrR family transcriptional regulator
MAGLTRFGNLPQAKRERIVAAALSEFAEHGYKAASVNRIVGRLGIAKGSLFQYFGSKLGLFEYVFAHAASLLAQALREVREATSGLPLFERVRRILLAGVEFIGREPAAYRLYLRTLFQEDAPDRERFLSEVRRLASRYLTPLVAEAKDKGELRPGIGVQLAVFCLDGALDRFLQATCVPFLDNGTGLFGAGRKVVEQRASELVELLRCGLAGDGGRTKRASRDAG